MQQINDILLKAFNKNIKASLLLKRAYCEIVNKDIVSITTDLVYKNSVLFIYVKDNMWATQLMQYKAMIFKKAKVVVKELKDIKILVFYPTEEKKITKKNKEHNHHCLSCGSTLLLQGNNFCSLCVSQKKAENSQRIQNLLNKHPWIKFEDIEPDQRKNLDYEAFMQEKKFKINKICDIIENEYFDIQKNKKAKKEFFRQKIEELVILKLSIEPSELTKEIIENNISKKIFKLYQD